MPDLNVAFWNVENLFEPGVVPRGPQSAAERNAKISQVAGVINAMFAGAGPDLLALCEVQTSQIVHALGQALQGQYLTLWEPPGMAGQTGLALLARTSRCADLQRRDVQRPSIGARPRVLLAEVALHGVDEPFLLAACHWKSRMQHGGVDDAADRMESSRWLGDLLADEDRTTAAIVIGDFNAEPFEPPFNELGLRGKRHFGSALWSQATPAYLYNTAWRALTEPSLWEEANVAGYEEPRPKTSHGDTTGLIFDQMLVSGRGLRNGPITLRERTVQYVVEPRTARRNASGAWRPRRWEYTGPGQFAGASDHFPIVATFAV